MWVTTLAFFWSLIVQVGDGTKWREFNTQWRFTAKFQHYFKWFSATSFLSSKTCFSLFLLYLLPVSNVDAKLVTKLEEGIAGGICFSFVSVRFHDTLGDVWFFIQKNPVKSLSWGRSNIVSLSLPLQRVVLSQRKQNGCSYLEAAYGVATATFCWRGVSMLQKRGRFSRGLAACQGRLARCFEMGCLFLCLSCNVWFLYIFFYFLFFF